MSFAHMKAVMDFEAGVITGSRLLLLLFLANYANDDGVCWPSKSKILEKTGLNERTFRGALAELQEFGAVTVEHVRGKGIKYVVALVTEQIQPLPEHPHCKNTVTAEIQGLQKYRDCKNTVTPTVKVQSGDCKNTVTPTVKIQSKPINNLSIPYQEPINSNSSDESVVPNTQVNPPRRRSSKPSIQKPEGVKQSVWEEWMKLKTARSRALNQHMVDGIVREASKAGMTTEEAMVCQLENGWQGFKAEWVANKHQSTKSLKNADVTEMDSWDAIYS